MTITYNIIEPLDMKVVCIKKTVNEKYKVPKIGKSYEVREIHFSGRYLEGTRNNMWYLVKGIKTNVHHSSLFKIINIDEETSIKVLKRNIHEFPIIKTLNSILI